MKNLTTVRLRRCLACFVHVPASIKIHLVAAGIVTPQSYSGLVLLGALYPKGPCCVAMGIHKRTMLLTTPTRVMYKPHTLCL